MTTTAGIPAASLDREPLDYPNGKYPSTAEREAALRDVLAAAGVELGAYDGRIVRWAGDSMDWSILVTIASWVKRAAEHPAD
ncbi:hypothetical protein [Streptomyces sp. NPDC005009]